MIGGHSRDVATLRPRSLRHRGHPEQLKEGAVADLMAIEARIWSLLEPYRWKLEPATIYATPSSRWPGPKARDYFASVRTGKDR